MKKAIFLLLITAMLAGCAKNFFPDKEADNCSSIIFVDPYKLTGTTAEEYRRRYLNRLADHDGTIPCRILIDVEKFKLPDGSYENALKDWLMDNEAFIDYESTEPYILCAHTISDQDEGELEDLDGLGSMSVKRFIEKIGAADFKDTYYKKHVSLYNNRGRLGIKLMSFDKDENCYSFPLLRIIAREHPNARLVFKIIKHDSNNKIIFYIRERGDILGFFNFSHIPPFL
jgi:putative VirB-like lipoprotein